MKSLAKSILTHLSLLAGLSMFFTGTLHASDSTNLPCGIGITVSSSDHVQIGNNATWTVSLTNSASSNRTCVVNLDISAVGYNGEQWTNLCWSTTTNVLAPGGTNLITQTATPNDYADWPGSTLRGLCVLEIQETNDVWLSVSETSFTIPTNTLTISPTPPIPVSGIVTAQVSYLNPYQFSLQGVVVNLTADELLSTNASVAGCEFQIGTVGTNQYITATTNFVAGQSGTGHVWATISGSNLTAISTSCDVPISE